MAVATTCAWRLTTKLVLPGDRGATRVLERAWHLAMRDARQAVWNEVPPGDARGAPGNFGCRVGS